jgi:anti-anti-sigma factor
MNIEWSRASAQVRLRLAGRFDFNGHRAFRSAYASALEQPGVSEIVVDFDQVDYLDSSALGMLLILRDHASESGKRVVLEHCRGTVGDVLRIANFQELFPIQ